MHVVVQHERVTALYRVALVYRAGSCCWRMVRQCGSDMSDTALPINLPEDMKR